MFANREDVERNHWLFVWHKGRWPLVSESPFETEGEVVDAVIAFNFVVLYKWPAKLYRVQNMKSQNEIIGMRQLTNFQADHSAFGGFVLLRSSFVDTMSYVCADKATTFADQDVMIRLDVAKALIRELQKRVDYIEAGIENNAVHLVG